MVISYRRREKSFIQKSRMLLEPAGPKKILSARCFGHLVDAGSLGSLAPVAVMFASVVRRVDYASNIFFFYSCMCSHIQYDHDVLIIDDGTCVFALACLILHTKSRIRYAFIAPSKLCFCTTSAIYLYMQNFNDLRPRDWRVSSTVEKCTENHTFWFPVSGSR